MIKETIDRFASRKVCDAGGGANPLLSLDYIQEKGLEYTVLDYFPERELDRAPSGYHKVTHDILSSDNSFAGRYDFIFTKMQAEHVPDGETFHQNIYNMLKPGRIAVHFFPTLYAPPLVVNWLISE